ncbi:MAG: TIR domain-containing protein [Paludibacteraceae bacterium]|nr:TIR domain-containing protein [Paludibacteraceae bacterium]
MNHKVFFSYSHKDKQIAQKIYWDLISSGVAVWRDQVDGEPCANFKDEFLNMVDECEIFLVLDSENYRSNSSWCLLEIEKYFNKQRTPKRMFVGLLQPPGEWRNRFRNEREELYFNKLNEQIYIKLFADGIYDNDAQYAQGMARLIEYFGGSYLPWHTFPEEEDMLDELANIDECYKISDAERNSILADFRIIRQRHLQGAHSTEKRIALWIDDCEFMKLQLIIPYLYSAILLMDEGRYDEAIERFDKIVKYHENDPRGYRGVGLCQGLRSNYCEAVAAFDKALIATDRIGGKHLNYKWEILVNRSRALMEIGDFKSAAEGLNEAMKCAQRSDMDVINTMMELAFCYRRMNYDMGKRIALLEDARKLNVIEERIYVELGNCYLDLCDYGKALEQFKKAYGLVKSVRNAFALFLCYANLHDRNMMNETFRGIDKLLLDNAEDFYYYGYILYIMGDKVGAKSYYGRCNRDLWKWYG